jgi:CBS domain-containing protein
LHRGGWFRSLETGEKLENNTMQVREIMINSPLTCGPHANLAEVAHLMWIGDCGIVPVTDDHGKLLGVVTDRDICIAASTRDRQPSSIHVDELPRGDVHACRPDDDTREALRLMRTHRVRRLPVTASDGTLRGVISINDVVVAAGERAPLSAADVLETFKSICAHPSALESASARSKSSATATSTSRTS